MPPSVNGGFEVVASLTGILDDPAAVRAAAEDIEILRQKIDIVDGDKVSGKSADDGGLLPVKISKALL